jgi:hypothetical protein
LIPPNIVKDFSTFQSYHWDQRPAWKIFLTLPYRIYVVTKDIFFPPKKLTPLEELMEFARRHRKMQNKRNAHVDVIIQQLGLTGKEALERRRWEQLIYDSKSSMSSWDWDAKFANFEDYGEREALYLAIFDHFTVDLRLRRERFHREAMNRINRLSKNLPPIEKREFTAKEVAIAAAHGHIGNILYKQLTGELGESESMISRDKLYKTLVVDYFIPRLEKFRGVIQERDDFSKLEQTRWFWRPKRELVRKIDDLLALCRLERNWDDKERAEWIYELFMCHKFYVAMENREGEALEYTYWAQGPEFLPEGYISPDEEAWKLRMEVAEEAEKRFTEARLEAQKKLGDDVEIVKSIEVRSY